MAIVADTPAGRGNDDPHSSADKDGPKDKDGYVAVVYFHGMGSQRRYEELSRLIDALDRFAHGRDAKLGFGILGKIRARLEPPRSRLPREVGYVTLLHRRSRPDGGGERRAVRFYEAYWANVTAGGVPVRKVLTWLLKQAPAPLRALFTPWRLRARLRRAALHELWPRLARGQPGTVPGDLKRLLDYYDEYEGPEARRHYKKGNVTQFAEYVRACATGPGQADRMVALARSWCRGYIAIELRNLFVVVTLLLSLLLVGLVLAFVVVGLLHATTELLPQAWLSWLGEDALTANKTNVISGIVILLTAIGVTRFIGDYLGDVQFWTTYEETAEKSLQRRQILDTCAESLAHVLLAPDCRRVVVVGHSLGTTVAFDTILELARRNRAASPANLSQGPVPLEKLQHFITFASPIDKVHYFFESYAGRYHRYNRVVEELRGDVGTWPFAANGLPLIRWINFWDRADIIAGALQTPVNRAFPSLTVDNVEVASRIFPNPGAAHSAYFDHADVIEKIYRAVFEDAYSVRNPPLKPDGKPDYTRRVGPGVGLWTTRGLQLLMLALPWLCAAYLAGRLLELQILRSAAVYVAIAAIVVLLLSWLVSHGRGHLHRY